MSNTVVYDGICKVLGGTPPEHFVYELFLDEKGEKISKSKGNGLTIDEWLTYATPESLALFMFQKPKSAKKLHFDVIPRAVDDYLQFLGAYPNQDPKAQLDNPVWHIHAGEPPAQSSPISFALLRNLVAASNAENKDVLWGYIRRHMDDATPEKYPLLDTLAGYAVRYYRDFELAKKSYRTPDDVERSALQALSDALAAAPAAATAEELQGIVYDIGRSVPRYQDLNAKGATPSGPACRTRGSRRSTRCCLAKAKDRASDRSSRSTASRRRGHSLPRLWPAMRARQPDGPQITRPAVYSPFARAGKSKLIKTRSIRRSVRRAMVWAVHADSCAASCASRKGDRRRISRFSSHDSVPAR